MKFLDLISRDTRLKKVASKDGGEYACPCLWCGGRDRFRVWPNRERPGYWCRQCGRKGDAIQYLRDRDGLTYREACERLHLHMADPSSTNRPLHPPRLASAPPSPWQVKAQAFCDACEQALWFPVGAKALTYLRGRGLHDETIREARLGYHMAERWDAREAWGLQPDPAKKPVWLPRGITFPCYVGPVLWRAVIRRPVKMAKDKYICVIGGGNPVYRVDTLQAGQPAMLTEGYLDGLAILQEAGDLISVVAAGSTTWGRLERWVGRLALSSLVLVAFDADAAGEGATAWWLQALGHRAKRWRPYWDDPAAMLQAGVDLRTWVREGLDLQPKWWRELASWPDDRRERWEERAAVMEIEGGLSRDEAEREAVAVIA